MCGEYAAKLMSEAQTLELPPRVRRIRIQLTIGFFSTGTTSACAENTPKGAMFQGRNRNYLRVCGEYGILKHALD